MPVYKIAGMNIAVEPRYEYTAEYMKDYLTDSAQSELTIKVSDELMAHESRLHLQIHGYEPPEWMCEVVAVLRVICDYIINHGGFFLHCSCLSIDGQAIVFTAPSGTGKSTHAALWRRHFGDRVEMINDDKPLVREEDGRFVIYGTPWNGKHHIGNNISAPIAAVFFLEQAKENSAEPLSAFNSLGLLMQQTILPTKREDMAVLLDMLGRFIENTPMFKLRCDISDEAVMTSYTAYQNSIK